MKTRNFKILTMMSFIFAACGMEFDYGDPSALGDRIVAGHGANVPGIGATSVPTTNAVVTKMVLAFPTGFVSSTTGNFSTALTKLRTNLPRTSNPLSATGYENIGQLAYAACTDVDSTEYGSLNPAINLTQSIANNQAGLMAYWMGILNKYTAGLAGASSATAQVTATLNTLRTEIAAVPSNTTLIAAIAGCYAAHSAGVSMLGQ